MKIIRFLIWAAIALVAGSALGYADSVEEQLAMLQQELKTIKETQQQILAGQEKLSQEHAEIKIWINKRR